MNLTKWKIDRLRCSDIGLTLIDNDANRIVALIKNDDGTIQFAEQCDGFFWVGMSKEDAKQALREAIEWIDCVDDRGG